MLEPWTETLIAIGTISTVGMLSNLGKFWLQRNVPKHPLLGEIYDVSLWDYIINLSLQLVWYPGLCVAGWLHWRAAHGGSAADVGEWAVGGWLGTARLYGPGTDLLLLRASLYVFAANLVRDLHAQSTTMSTMIRVHHVVCILGVLLVLRAPEAGVVSALSTIVLEVGSGVYNFYCANEVSGAPVPSCRHRRAFPREQALLGWQAFRSRVFAPWAPLWPRHTPATMGASRKLLLWLYVMAMSASNAASAAGLLHATRAVGAAGDWCAPPRMHVRRDATRRDDAMRRDTGASCGLSGPNLLCRGRGALYLGMGSPLVLIRQKWCAPSPGWPLLSRQTTSSRRHRSRLAPQGLRRALAAAAAAERAAARAAAPRQGAVGHLT